MTAVTIATVVGTRPQFVKASAVSPKLAALPGVEEIIIHTGQHYDSNLSEVFFEELRLAAPAVNLGVAGERPAHQIASMISGIDETLEHNRVDMVLVYGDTNSTLAGAVAATKRGLPLAHVEAGLRSFNRMMPEELNRVLTDHASDILFAPTRNAVENLEREGIDSARVHLVGDVMYDLALRAAARADAESAIVARLGLEKRGYVLATVHRAENTDDGERLATIVEALGRVAGEMTVVFPVHPRTSAAAERAEIDLSAGGRIRLIEPVGYLDMVSLEKSAVVVVTDSGGVQKEAFFFGKPCVTVRTETEWVELVEGGWNQIVPPFDAEPIVSAILRSAEIEPSARPALYGEGDASELIAGKLARFLSQSVTPTRAHQSS